MRLGAGLSYTRIVEELADLTPSLAMASRTVGSPQIRNRGTVGGNLGTASPAGDAHPPLLATRAVVELEGPSGQRLVPIDDYFVGPKRSVLAPDELIRAVRIPVADGPQQFSKIGPRNATGGLGAIRAFGEHKGSGLALVCDLLAGAFTGGGSSGPVTKRARIANGMLSIYISPKHFGSPDEFLKTAEDYVAWVKTCKPIVPGGEVLAPGDFTAIDPVDLVFDTAGGDRLARSPEVLKPGGRIVTVSEETDHGTYFLVESDAAQLRELASMLAAGELRVPVAATYALPDARKAFEAGAGKVVLLPDGER